MKFYRYFYLGNCMYEIFQQDGTPVHWSFDVWDLLNRHLPGKWIARDGPTAWPPRSPDITPLNFFFWGYVKDRVYKTAAPVVASLRRRIVADMQTVYVSMLQCVCVELEYGLGMLRATRGAQVEVSECKEKFQRCRTF